MSAHRELQTCEYKCTDLLCYHNVYRLRASGYCVVSRRFGHLARIDSPDWDVRMMEMGMRPNADWYRRILTKDSIIVNPNRAANLFENSGQGPPGYVERHDGLRVT